MGSEGYQKLISLDAVSTKLLSKGSRYRSPILPPTYSSIMEYVESQRKKVVFRGLRTPEPGTPVPPLPETSRPASAPKATVTTVHQLVLRELKEQKERLVAACLKVLEIAPRETLPPAAPSSHRASPLDAAFAKRAELGARPPRSLRRWLILPLHKKSEPLMFRLGWDRSRLESRR